MKKKLVTEELDAKDIKTIKDIIAVQLTKLFYTLYVKKSIWSS